MEVKLDKRYPLEVDRDRAWRMLRDVAGVAGCMPGAAITEQTDERHYKGNVKVKVGPAGAAFAGDIEVLALDEATMTLQLLGKGADRGGSSASMDLRASIEAGDTPATSVLVGQAAVIVNGKFAQFGGRLMTQVSDMLLAQFADNFRAAAAALPETQAATAAASEPAAVSVATPAVSAAAGTQAVQAAPAVPVSPVAPAAPAKPPAPVAPAAKPNEINALAIAWHLVKGWFAGLLGRRQA